ncbi:MAG: hypothetical protein ISS41_03695 [Candidatus Aminicenantes bacterium]|nr:hypothetical protein [Candidatus Aminicenantes bacterium]MBL7082721.1 hypothetical protein [Candidatus Aminicenantes bacterium]
MAHLNILLLTVFLPLLSTTTQNIEKAFLQNNPKILYSLFSSESAVNISLPEPISFSDQVSNQQAYFLFRKIFSSFTTFEFYSETELPLFPEEKSFIFKARWSFKDDKNNNQHVIHIFFYLTKETIQKNRNSPFQLSQKNKETKNTWKIIEIKAEKI